jgi:hypothetical protein
MLAVLNMYRIKRARSVIHSLAHHAVSALSFLHPRLGEECLQSGLTEVKFDLIAELITGKEFKGSKETMSAYNALKATFEQILQSEGMDLSCIKTASINFGFKKDSWPSFCICTMTGLGTEPIHIKVDWCGNKYNLLSEC